MSLLRLPVAVALLALTACSTVAHTEGEVLTLRFAPLTLALVVAVPSAIVLLGVLLAFARETRALGLCIALGVGALAALIVPGIVMDAVTVTPEALQQRTGFWFMPNVKGFRFADVARVRLVRKQVHQGVQVIWEVVRRDGQVVEIDPGDLWDDNTEILLPRLTAAGIAVEDARATR